MGNSNKRIAINTGVLYVRLILTLLITLLSTRFVLDGLGKSYFGLYNLIAGIVTLFGFLSGTMAATTQRFISYEHGKSNDVAEITKVFNTSILLHIIVTFILSIIVLGGGYICIQFILNIQPEDIGLARIVLLTVTLGLIWTILSSPFEAVLMAHENIVYFAILRLLMAIVQLGIAFSIPYYPGNKLTVYAVLMSVVPFLILVGQAIYCRFNYPEVKLERSYLKLRNNPLVKSMSSFAGYSLFGNLGWTVRSQGYSIILNIFWGVIINAAVGIANQVYNALLTFSSALTTSIRPQLIQAAGANDIDRVRQLTQAACRYPSIILSLIGIPLFVAMPYVLSLWLQDVPDYSVFFCRVLVVDVILNQSSIGLALIMDAKGQIRALHTLISFSLILFTGISYLVGLMYESPYLIYSCILLNDLFIISIRFIIVRKYTRIWDIELHLNSLIFSDILKPILISTLFAIVGLYLWSLFPASIYWLLIYVICTSALFLLTVWYFIMTASERNKVSSTIKNRLR